MESSHEEKDICKRNQNKPLFSGWKRFTEILSQALQGTRKDIKEMRREEQEDPSTRSTRSIHEESSKSSSHGYVNSAISPNIQHSISDFFMKRKKGGVTKKDTLGEYL